MKRERPSAPWMKERVKRRTASTSPKGQLLGRHVGDGAFERHEGVCSEACLTEVGEESLRRTVKSVNHPTRTVGEGRTLGKGP